MTYPKCPKCKKRYVYKQGDLCEACGFVPKIGKLPEGYKIRSAEKREKADDDRARRRIRKKREA